MLILLSLLGEPALAAPFELGPLHPLPMHARGVPRQIDPVVAEIQRLTREGADLNEPWAPSVVPLHITRIGSFALVSLPSEPTTMSGWRIAETVRKKSVSRPAAKR